MKLAFNVRYLILGLMVYIIALVLSFPAERAYAYWKSSDKSAASNKIVLMGITGSVWSGRASSAVLKRHQVTDLNWSLRPWVMLMGKVGLRWQFKLPDSSANSSTGFGKGVVSMGLDGSSHFSSIEAQLPASVMASMARLDALQPSGSVSVSLKDVEWDGENLVSVNGKVVWQSAGLNLLKSISLGDLSLSFETSDDSVKGLLTDGGGPLMAEGLVTLDKIGGYKFNGTFASRGDKDLENNLRTMGKPGPDGKVKINYSGKLASLGL